MIRESDLQVHSYRDASWRRLWCAVKVTHIPSGISAVGSSKGSQIEAKANALEKLHEALEVRKWEYMVDLIHDHVGEELD